MTDQPCRLYAVSSGNGNDGVSHSFPDYYCYTNDPFRLAELAMVTSFKAEYQEAAREAVQIDGESDYTISATIYDPLDEEPSEDDGSYCDANGAWQIIEVFPDDEGPDMSDPWHTPLYYSLADCFGDAVSLVPAD